MKYKIDQVERINENVVVYHWGEESSNGRTGNWREGRKNKKGPNGVGMGVCSV
jgi:hypothetical protein